MAGRKYDIAIAGGGLSGGLIALALHRLRPDLSILLVEQVEALGSGHRWTWFASDLSADHARLLSGFRQIAWDDGYDVRFPSFRRRLATPVVSLAAADVEAGLRRDLPAGAIRTSAPIASLDARGITLASGEEISARAVIDCRGFAPSPHLAGGWRQFMSRHMQTPEPHGLARPMMIDTTVDQRHALNFVQVLPLGAHELFIESICYSLEPTLDRRAHSIGIDAYCRRNGWAGDILGSEAGIVPIVTGGDFAGFQQDAIAGVAIAGRRAGLFDPFSGQSLAFAARTALAIAEDADLTGEQLAALLQARASGHWRAMRYHRRLAGHPQRVLERLHRLPRGLVERFHAGRSTWTDRLRLRLPATASPPSLALAAPMAQRQKP